jgi:predicted nucleic acid-binding protein
LIFDTDILVWYLKKRAEAAAFIQAVPIGERRVSVVSVLELLHGCRTRTELRDAKEFIEDGLAEVVPITPSISAKAQEIMQQFVLSRKPGALDTLIAATALERGDVLATGNVKHFNHLPGLSIKAFSV